MKLDSADSARSPRRGRIVGWVRNVVARVRGNRLQQIDRAEFEQVARDLDLSDSELYGLLTGRRVSSELLEQKWALIEPSSESNRKAQASEAKQLSARAQAWLPIGPSCC